MISCENPDNAKSLLQECGALLTGHFTLSSGLHSPAYVQCAKLFEHPQTAKLAVAKIAARIQHLLPCQRPQTIMTPAIGGLLMGYELAMQLGCRNVFAERPTGVFELRRGFRLEQGERVWLAEDVVTTGGSIMEIAKLVEAAGAQVVGWAAVIDRSGGQFTVNDPAFAYTVLDLPKWTADACPLCAQGEPLYKPGSRK